MLFFRSEERAREWCATRGHRMRPLVRLDQLWTLATTWYATRLQATSRRPGPDEMRAIFAGLGLEGDFRDSSGAEARHQGRAPRRRRRRPGSVRSLARTAARGGRARG